MKKGYEYKVTYRRAGKKDDFQQIARLLHSTDPFIYPSWCRKSAQFASAIAPHMNKSGFIFNYHNIYVAVAHSPKLKRKTIVAAAIVLTNQTNLVYNYNQFHTEDQRVISEHILPTIQEARNLPDHVAYGIALCIKPNQRHRGIGTGLFECVVDDLRAKGFTSLEFTCLTNNAKALGLYENMGCEIISGGIGFGKAGMKPPAIVTLVKSL